MIDYLNPDFTDIFRERAERLTWLRRNPDLLPPLKRYYAEHKAQFISDWAITVDPRVAAKKQSPVMPFVLFPKQVELMGWIEERFAALESGIVVKSRDVGASWIVMAWSCTSCLFQKDFMIGVGSAKEDKIDRSGDPDTLFYKARMFLQNLPIEFLGGWTLAKHSAHLRLYFPETGSSITGEAGDNIGRGGRKAVYFVDEAAHVERPKLIDASLAATTDCRIDMSSVNTMANSFAEKAHSGMINRFDFGWRDDPRKDDAWYAAKTRALDPVIVAQEIDCNFNASAEGVIIPSAWVLASIGLHLKLGIKPTGQRRAALDVADQGRDKNALADRHGPVLLHCEMWSGRDSDLFATVSKAFSLCDERGLRALEYDADGMGAGVRGDARVLNEKRTEPKADRRPGTHPISVVPFRGSGAVLWPEKKCPRADVKNEDMFANYKAQSWWNLRLMFNESWKASKGEPYDPEMLICIDPDIPEVKSGRLGSELSQPVWKWLASGKRIVDKVPDDTMSPNLADSVMMCYSPRKGALHFSDELLAKL